MNIDQLVAAYPVLYHMAMDGSWRSIRAHGLLSTASLLALFEADASNTHRLTAVHRPECVDVSHPEHGRATIRDQKPMIESKLVRSLKDGLSASAWYQILNERVFFWLTEERLTRLLSAKAYRDQPHDVLLVDARSLLNSHSGQIELAAMNTGNTQPFAHPRGRDTFLDLEKYPYEGRVARRLEPVVELTVLGGVRDIENHVIRVERRQANAVLDIIYP